jgi:hypothetical protein
MKNRTDYPASDGAADKPHPEPGKVRHTPAEAAARIRELRKGNLLPPGVTIKDLINHGRA